MSSALSSESRIFKRTAINEARNEPHMMMRLTMRASQGGSARWQVHPRRGLG
eukprot:CAMPEP_0179915374 /NCGR_PEP_ID=MMETSP0983-20121128/1629_1 /TAXON_ID=483367 /ORGANISM="non described non described, Strain CCMP 2436" /LENGTH=51 /DNA_ID=CAMNT_0021817765 /DNA_START=128 /DNA_END=281 /DNA_ORIENTATION=+